VTLNLGVWVLGAPRLKHLHQRVLLILRAVVNRSAISINAAHITNVQAISVVASNAVADCVIWRKCDNIPICLNYLVISVGLPFQLVLPVPLDAANGCRLWRGRAMDNKVFDLSHIVELSGI